MKLALWATWILRCLDISFVSLFFFHPQKKKNIVCMSVSIWIKSDRKYKSVTLKQQQSLLKKTGPEDISVSKDTQSSSSTAQNPLMIVHCSFILYMMTQKNDLVNGRLDSLNRLITSENCKFKGRTSKINFKVIWHVSWYHTLM